MPKYLPGESGNPNGKKKGTLNKRTQLAKLLEPHAEQLVNKALEMALNSDPQMLRLLLDRLLPAKPRDDPLPEIGELSGTIAEQCEKILSLISAGDITPTEANNLLQAIESKAKLVELREVKERLLAIETALKQRDKNDK